MDDRVNFCFPVYTLSVHYKVNTISIMFDSSFIRFFFFFFLFKYTTDLSLFSLLFLFQFRKFSF